jgi:hypothetical protein
MAGGRLIAVAALAITALAACDGPRAAAAQPTPRVAPMQPDLRAAMPAGWVPLPGLAHAASAAAVEVRGATVVAAAWGDAAAGCYLLALDVRGTERDKLDAVVQKLGWHLDAQAAMHAWTTPPGPVDPAEVTGRLTVGGLTGALRAVVSFDARSLPRAGLAACFYNDREPTGCEQACAALLPHLAVPPVMP